MKIRKALLLITAIASLACAPRLLAQSTGYPPFGSFQTGNFEGINLQDLNVNFSLPVITSSGRGINACSGNNGTYSSYAIDGSGYYGSTDANYNLKVIGPAGTAPAASSIIDTNGNYITQTVNGSETDYTDSVGRIAGKVITNTTSNQ